MRGTRAGSAVWRAAARAPMELWALGAGAALSYAQAPWPPAVALPVLFGVLAAAFVFFDRLERPRRATRIGWCVAFGYFFVGLWWIGAAFDIYADRHGWMKPFAMTLLPAFLALFWAAAFGAAAWLARRFGAAGWRRSAILVIVWSLVEFARGGVLTGFPWSLFGYAWLDTPAAQLSAWIGPYGLTAATLGVALLLGQAAIAARAGRRASALRLAGVWFGACLALNAAGWSRLPAMSTPEDGPIVRLIQPNVPQADKTDLSLVREQTTQLANQTAVLSDDPVYLVIWPETASPFLLEWAPFTRAQMAALAPGDARLVIGAHRFDPGDRLWRNSLYVLNSEGAIDAVYDKRHLVPFGEWIPFRETLKSIGVTEIASALEPGDNAAQIVLGDGRSFIALICYEAVFPSLAAPAPESGGGRPDFIVHITNDAWFGDSAGPWQHLAQTRFRAIERGLPIYRAANSGVSAAIDPYGRLVAYAPLNTRDILDIRLQFPAESTIYARIGEGGWLLLLAGGVVMLVTRLRAVG